MGPPNTEAAGAFSWAYLRRRRSMIQREGIGEGTGREAAQLLLLLERVQQC